MVDGRCWGVLLGGVALAVLSAVGGGLPDGYVELTCITSDGNQYLDTGYTPTSVDFGFELEFTFKGTVGTGGTRIIGSSTRKGTNPGVFVGSYQGAAASSGGQMWFCGACGTGNPGIVPNRWMSISLKRRRYTASSASTSTTVDLSGASDTSGFAGSVWLASVHQSSDNKAHSPGDWYRLKLYEGDALVHDFVPAKDSSGQVGLYDVAGNLGFRTSAVSGKPFVAGDEVESGSEDSSARVVKVDNEWYYEGSIAGDPSGDYLPDTNLTFTAVANEGYRFAGWSGDVGAAEIDGNTAVVRVTGESPRGIALWANFEKLPRPHVFSMSIKATSFAAGGDLVNEGRRDELIDWLLANGFTKVYLETYRHNVYAPTELLATASNEFAAAGLDVCGLITPTCLDLDPSATPVSGSYETCFSNPFARERLSNEVARCARLFNTILFDDFLFASCPQSCPHCRSTSVEFRTELVNAVCREILATAREVNPRCHCIIKYANWYDSWTGKGLNPALQTAIFGECWVGSETRDAGSDPLWACNAYDYLNSRCGGRCGGVWFDPLDSTPAKYVEQAYYSILSGAPESLFHCFDYMLADNGGTTPYGESFKDAYKCTDLLEERMEELHALADFCDAAERGEVKKLSNGISQHYYTLNGATYVARVNTSKMQAGDEFGVLAPNQFGFPLLVAEATDEDCPDEAEYFEDGRYMRVQHVYSEDCGNGFTASIENYIDTGYTPASTSVGFYFDFVFDGTIGKDAPRIMGSSIRDKNNNWGGLELGAYNSTGGGEFFAFGHGPQELVNPRLRSGCRMTLDFRNGILLAADGGRVDLSAHHVDTDFNGNIWIGCVHSPDYSTKKGCAPLKVYRYKIYEGDEVVHDFVPVKRVEDGAAGLYDLVGGKGFRVGTGFKAGTWTPRSGRGAFRQLQYIESDGLQYFDLGVPTATNVAFEAEMASVYEESTENNYIGAVYGSSSGWMAIGDYGEGKLVSYYATKSRQGTGVEIPYDTLFHHYYCGNGLQVIDGVTNHTVSAKMPDNVATVNLWAFKANLTFSGSSMAKLKIKYLNVYLNGVLVRQLVPVNAGGRIGMLDKLSGQFYLNEGAGSFAAGPPCAKRGLIIRYLGR